MLRRCQRIGEAICRALARSGYSIALHYSTSGVEAEQTAKHIYKEGGVCATFACDLADAHATEDLVPCVLEEFGRLDVLVNSASIFEKSTLAEGSLDVWDRHFAVNLKAPYILIRSFAHYAKKGSIVNILDTHVSRNKTTYAAYLLSKKTLGELTKMAAVEFAPRIRVNAVALGLSCRRVPKRQDTWIASPGISLYSARARLRISPTPFYSCWKMIM